MKAFLKTTVAGAAMAGAAMFASAPAEARVDLGISIGVPGVAFEYDSGGYCGPVYWGGEWYRGPVYYREYRGEYWYWIHGGWRRDEWRGPRPRWWRHYRYGPALGFEWYRGHGFRIPERHLNWWRMHGNEHRFDRDRREDMRDMMRDRDRELRDRDHDMRDHDMRDHDHDRGDHDNDHRD